MILLKLKISRRTELSLEEEQCLLNIPLIKEFINLTLTLVQACFGRRLELVNLTRPLSILFGGGFNTSNIS